MVDSKVCPINQSMSSNNKWYTIHVKSGDVGFTLESISPDREISLIHLRDADAVGSAAATIDIVKLNYQDQKLKTAAVTLSAGKGDTDLYTLREMIDTANKDLAKDCSLQVALRFNYTATKDGTLRLKLITSQIEDMMYINK